MAAILENGDYVADGKGFLQKDDILCEALFRLGCRRGSFPLMPEMGSRLYLLSREKPSARNMAARQYAVEALEGLNAEVEDATVLMGADGTAQVTVMLRYEGETLSLEVKV